MRPSEPLTEILNMFVAVIFIPVVAANAFTESSSMRVPEISERSMPLKTYMIFDPCNINKPGNRTVSCAQLRRMGYNVSEDYWISPYTDFFARCDMDTDGGGWTIIQRRSWDEEGEDKFEKSEKEYEKGFYGGVSSYWIGNENIHALTSHPSNEQALRIELTKQNNKRIIVNYGKFKVGSKNDGYMLTYDDYWSPNGTEYDGLAFHNRTKFSVMKQNDRVDSCSKSRRSGGWWYPPFGCLFSNLNGRKFKSGVPQNNMGHGITWYKIGDMSSFRDVYESVEMKVRDADYKFCTGKMATMFSYT
uniref:Putative ficolin/ixoderin n=1 Tax=Ixodes ricinus TaxID=34613 RepID=A0A0K8RK19_IXORI